MSVEITTAHDETAQITYLYKTIDAGTQESPATVDAEMDGLDRDVLERARDIIYPAVQGEELEVAYMATSREEQTTEPEEMYAAAVGFMEEFGDMENDNEEERMENIQVGREICKLALWMPSDVVKYGDR